jgi:centromere protein I
VTLEEISSVDKFVQNLEKIELPNQLAAVLADPLLQTLLLLRPDQDSHVRVSNWIRGVVQDAMDGDMDASSLAEVLEVLQDYVEKTKVPPLLLILSNLPRLTR